MSPLDARSRAIARGRSYDLLGSLFLSGPVRLEHLRAVSVLAPHVPSLVSDEDLAWHHRMFSVEVLPYESAFLSVDMSLGGERTMALADLFARCGCPVENPDHIASQLSVLSRLCGAEADALRDDLPEVERIRQLIDEVLAGHLLQWLPPFVAAVQDVDSGIYRAASGLLLEVARDHFPGEVIPELGPPVDGSVGLKELAKQLATPARSGVWITPTAITRIARELGIPRGFGKRWMLIENLFATAARHGRVGELLGGLQPHIRRQADASAWATRQARTATALTI